MARRVRKTAPAAGATAKKAKRLLGGSVAVDLQDGSPLAAARDKIFVAKANEEVKFLKRPVGKRAEKKAPCCVQLLGLEVCCCQSRG